MCTKFGDLSFNVFDSWNDIQTDRQTDRQTEACRYNQLHSRASHLASNVDNARITNVCIVVVVVVVVIIIIIIVIM